MNFYCVRNNLPEALNLLRRRLAQSETFIGKICGDDESDPANPDGHHNVPDRDVPPADEASGVKQSYQREKHCGDEGKGSLCHVAPRWVEKAAMFIRAYGHASTETLVATPWKEFLAAL
jgi:hypothetical protein